MQISNISKNKNSGFTLVELVVVIAGIAALGSFTIPNLLNSIKLNKIEEAKAIMNGYASECLGKFRISTDPVDFIENATPEQLDDLKLNTLGYMIDGDKNKCSDLGIKPSNEKEIDLYSFDFAITSDGQIIKTGTPSDNPRFLNSCRGWAGKNCGLSDAQKAEFARIAEIAKNRSECLSEYSSWLSAGGSANFRSWNKDAEECNRVVWAWKGQPVNSEEAYLRARDAEYGDICEKWVIENSNDSSYISEDGAPETKEECAGQNYWFHSGKWFTSQSEWDEANEEYKSDVCQSDIKNSLGKKTGEYTPNRYPGTPPCSIPVWICGKTVYPSLASYKTSSCGKPAPIIGGGGESDNNKVPERCRNFVPNSFCGGFLPMSNPNCTCK